MRSRPGTRRVNLEQLLIGPQDGIGAIELARRLDDLSLGSTRLVDGPHASILIQASIAAGTNKILTDEEILASDYAGFATKIMAAGLDFFGCKNEKDLIALARRYIEWGIGEAGRVESQGGTRDSRPVLIARVRSSDMYQVIDGHHRAARAFVRGERELSVARTWLPVETPLQRHLRRMSWLDGQGQVLYQPISAPELAGWITVRKCTDRLSKMLRLCEDLGLPFETSSYLDVASCYGWFVASMSQKGFQAKGVERDPLAEQLGRSVYRLRRDQVEVADARIWLEACPTSSFDVVSCFSLVHHFVLAEGEEAAERFFGQLDRVTAKVLFLDSGEAHESWMRERAPQWTRQRIRQTLQDSTTFSRVVDLGPDEDATDRYSANYGRHLFACIRD